MLQTERALKKMSAGDIIDYSIEVYKRNFKKVTILSLIFYVPFLFLYSAFTNSFSSVPAIFGGNRYNTPETGAGYILLILFAGILYLFYILTIYAVMSSAVSKVIYDDIVYQRSRKLKTIIKESFKKFPSLFGYKTLFYLIMAGIAFAILIVASLLIGILSSITGILGVTSMESGGYAGVGIFVVIMIIMYLLLIFSLIVAIGFFYIKFGMGIQVIATENRGATEAISRSLLLSRFNFKSSFGALLFGLILYYFIPTLGTGIVSVLLITDPEAYKSIYFVISTAIQVIQAVFYPFIITLMTVIFINMKINNEGLDLEVKVNGLLEQQYNTGAGEQPNANFEQSEH